MNDIFRHPNWEHTQKSIEISIFNIQSYLCTEATHAKVTFAFIHSWPLFISNLPMFCISGFLTNCYLLTSWLLVGGVNWHSYAVVVVVVVESSPPLKANLCHVKQSWTRCTIPVTNIHHPNVDAYRRLYTLYRMTYMQYNLGHTTYRVANLIIHSHCVVCSNQWARRSGVEYVWCETNSCHICSS